MLPPTHGDPRILPSSSSLNSSLPQPRSCLGDGMWVVVALAAAKLLLHCVYNTRYGYFRDEFDYLACGHHLAWGYVDHPPLVPFLTYVSGRGWESRCRPSASCRHWRLP
jgi:hypothetical protein